MNQIEKALAEYLQTKTTEHTLSGFVEFFMEKGWIAVRVGQ